MKGPSSVENHCPTGVDYLLDLYYIAEYPPSGILVPWTWILFSFLFVPYCEILIDDAEFYLGLVSLENSND